MPLQLDLSLPDKVPASFHIWNSWYLEESQIPIYSLVDIGKSGIEEVASTIDAAYHDYMNFDQHEWPSITGVPGRWDFSHEQASIKDIFEYHMHKLNWQVKPYGAGWQTHWYGPGFLVVVGEDWRTKGLLMIHCDATEAGEGVVNSCLVPIRILASQMWSLLVDNWSFDDLKSSVAQIPKPAL